MIADSTVADAITASMAQEEALAAANHGAAHGVNKGLLDATFKSLLAADPLRFFDSSGSQIPGLFETNYSSGDLSGNSSWQLVENDKIEIPIRLVFRAPVSVLSVQDTLRNDSPATPENPQTIIIPGEDAGWTDASGADKKNVISIRLQLKCGPASGGGGGGGGFTINMAGNVNKDNLDTTYDLLYPVNSPADLQPLNLGNYELASIKFTVPNPGTYTWSSSFPTNMPWQNNGNTVFSANVKGGEYSIDIKPYNFINANASIGASTVVTVTATNAANESLTVAFPVSLFGVDPRLL
jgi:hypothetical protein